MNLYVILEPPECSVTQTIEAGRVIVAEGEGESAVYVGNFSVCIRHIANKANTPEQSAAFAELLDRTTAAIRSMLAPPVEIAYTKETT